MSIPQYPKYRDSGVEWLGELPEHWTMGRLKRHVRLLTEKTDRRDNPVGLENIESWTGRYVPTESEFEGEGIAFAAHDILFGKLRPYLAKVLVAESSGEAVGDFFVMRPTDGLYSQYAKHLLLNREFISIVDGSTFGSKMPRASWDSVGGMLIPVPPMCEQATIALFLDKETGKIDALVAEQHRLIELLTEKRKALISHAVTRGLNPDATMKSTGVEWLGDVPAHWEIRSLSSITTKITNGYVGPTRDILVNEGVRYLQSLHIKGNRIQFDIPYFVSENWSQRHKKSVLEVGDVLIVQTGDIGQVAVVTEAFAGCNCHALIVVSPLRSELEGEWLSWCLNSDYGFHSLLAIQTGALHPHLNCGNVKSIMIPVPPKDEQRRIVADLVASLTELDSLITEADRAISLLEERRAALTSAAVTGKIDVRSAVDAEAP